MRGRGRGNDTFDPVPFNVDASSDVGTLPVGHIHDHGADYTRPKLRGAKGRRGFQRRRPVGSLRVEANEFGNSADLQHATNLL